MTFSQNWRFVDIFTVDQAAALWCDIEPTSFNIIRPVQDHPEAAAIKQLIVGLLRAAKSAEPNSWMAGLGRLDYSPGEVEVTRQWLVELATKKGARPAFLFDTLLLNQAANEQKSGDAKAVQDTKPINKGGRPPEHDWDACIIEIIRIAHTPDGLPDSQAELVRKLSEWFDKTYGNEPAESSIKSRVSMIYSKLGLGRKHSDD